jgi:peptide-methionine (R)-S-oxide reductase
VTKRRDFLAQLLGTGAIAIISAPSYAQRAGSHTISRDFIPLRTRQLPWHQILERERFEILFNEETEFAGSSELNDEKREGTYICAACLLPLFRSQDKYDSGTGWPSFTRPIETHIATRQDFRRIEYHCARCLGHQGHVFDDGPPPRGERWCNNGLALLFVPVSEPLPALRP